VDNSIKFKELQLVGGVLRKWDEGLGVFFFFKFFLKFFFFQKGVFWVRRGG